MGVLNRAAESCRYDGALTSGVVSGVLSLFVEPSIILSKERPVHVKRLPAAPAKRVRMHAGG